MTSFERFRKNIYSQNGEDGVLEEILKRLQINSGTFVEFGAWDGKYLSNTYYLLEQGWHGVYIEGHKERFKDLQRNTKQYSSKIKLINEYVEIDGKNKLENLLVNSNLHKSFEVLSIDIDSYDWQVWQSLEKYNPKIVIIEINSSIPVGIYQTHRSNSNVIGSSFTATVDLGQKRATL